jgi:ABC-type molybdate transport system substrate-binding protein
MKKYTLLSAVAIIAVCNCDAARAAEVTLIAPGGIRAAVQQLIPAFERATGTRSTPHSAPAAELRSESSRASRSTCPSCNRHWSP